MPLTFEQITPYLSFKEDTVLKPATTFSRIIPEWCNRVVIISDRGLYDQYRDSPVYYIGVLCPNDMKDRRRSEYVKILTNEGFKYLRFYNFDEIILTSLPPSMLLEPED